MSDIDDEVRSEMRRFRTALPKLLKHRGKWVVFRDGEVKRACATPDAAYAAGFEMFGRDRAFVVAEVVEDKGPTPVTEGVFFGRFSS